MKKLLLVCSLTVASTVLFGQQIDVTDVFMSPQGQGAGDSLTAQELPSGDTVRFGFRFENNLNDTLKVGDSLTFGWSESSTLIMNLNNEVEPGGSITAFLVDDYELPDTGSFEMCVWPLHNPYNANTDENTGRFCKTFSIEAEDNGNGGTNSIAENAAATMKVYAGRNSVVIKSGEVSGQTQVTLFDLTGKQVHHRNINLMSNATERFNLNGLSKGMYVVRLSQSNKMVRTEKIVLR